jgi:hypothetical protein
MGTIKPEDIPDDKLEAVIERLQREKDARIDARVEAGEAIKINVSVVGDEDVEEAKARALKAAYVPPGKAVHFNIIGYRYPEFCSDGVTPNPMNMPSPQYEFGRWDGDTKQPIPESGPRYESDYGRHISPTEPPPLIVGEPHPVWTEIRRPGPNHHGEIAEGFYIVVDGQVHLSDELGKAIPGHSDRAGLDPMTKARRLLRGKAMQERPNEFWAPMRPAQTPGGW